MERRICTWTLLSLATVLSGVGAVKVDIPKDTYEHARGDNITLPCTFTPKAGTTPSFVLIQWFAEAEKVGAKEILIISYFSNTEITDIKSLYEGRVSLDVDVAKGKANLKLSSITLLDNKVFQCRVTIPLDDEGKPADTARLVVLVAPSTPVCKIEGKAEYGQDIKLTCLSAEGSPTPTYKWDIQDVMKMPRAPQPRTTDKGGVMSLFNITKETSGYYTCTSSNKIRSAKCNITLSVMPPSMNLGSTAGIIGGVVALLVVGLLILIIYCCCCRKKKKDDEYAMGARGEEYTDKEPAGNGESRRADGEEDAGGYEDSSVRRPTEHSEYENRRDNSDRRSDYDDPRSDYDDRRSDYDDRRSDYDDRRERPSDRNERYDDNRRYDDDRRYDDERRYDDRRDRRNDDDNRDDEPYDDRDRDRPPLPANKPPRKDYDV
ncbi:cell surface A33 antigen-like [Sebastes umbrosus]|uniref:cell surface A33 antigen-like n=1 Tax=Sebastes umbrosus TaxID=72105 RepID=UPI00189ED3E2|nr:cell surface A33 antigen-like [Sebastes umbrosus]